MYPSQGQYSFNPYRQQQQQQQQAYRPFLYASNGIPLYSQQRQPLPPRLQSLPTPLVQSQAQILLQKQQQNIHLKKRLINQLLHSKLNQLQYASLPSVQPALSQSSSTTSLPRSHPSNSPISIVQKSNPINIPNRRQSIVSTDNNSSSNIHEDSLQGLNQVDPKRNRRSSVILQPILVDEYHEENHEMKVLDDSVPIDNSIPPIAQTGDENDKDEHSSITKPRLHHQHQHQHHNQHQHQMRLYQNQLQQYQNQRMQSTNLREILSSMNNIIDENSSSLASISNSKLRSIKNGNLSELGNDIDNNNNSNNNNTAGSNDKDPSRSTSRAIDPKREEAKKSIQQLLKQFDQKINQDNNNANNTTILLMPLWRHRENAEKIKQTTGKDVRDPPPEKILRGKRLWRIIAIGIRVLYCEPLILSRNRKINSKDRDASEWNRTLLAFIDATSLWIGKMVKIPLQSVEQDNTLEFGSIVWSHDKNSSSFHSKSNKEKILQLKVRLKAIVYGLYNVDQLQDVVGIPNIISATQASAPNETQFKHVVVPQHILDFLAALISDGNYFPIDYLNDHEKSLLEFNQLGGIRNVVWNVAHEMNNDNRLNMIQYKDYMIHRAKLLIQHFIFFRILINRVILSPWLCGIGTQPKSSHTHQVVTNCRMIGTMMCNLIKRVDPEMKTSRDKISQQQQSNNSNNALESSTKPTVNWNDVDHGRRYHNIDINHHNNNNKDWIETMGLRFPAIKVLFQKSTGEMNHHPSQPQSVSGTTMTEVMNDGDIESILLRSRDTIESMDHSLISYLLSTTVSTEEEDNLLDYKDLTELIKRFIDSVIIQTVERKLEIDKKKLKSSSL